MGDRLLIEPGGGVLLLEIGGTGALLLDSDQSQTEAFLTLYDYRVPDNRPHFTVADNRPHYTADDGRPHYTVADNRPQFRVPDNRPHYTTED